MWLMPTRHRPGACQAVLDSTERMGMTSRGIVFIDGPDAGDYSKLRRPENWGVYHAPEHTELCGAFRWLYENYPFEAHYSILCDHYAAKTPGFDKLLEAAAGLNGLACGEEGPEKRLKKDGTRRICGAVVHGGDLVRKVGWLAPEGLVHLYHDDFWETIMAGKISFPGVMMENRPGAPDENHKRRFRGQFFPPNDRQLFESWVKSGEPERLRALI